MYDAENTRHVTKIYIHISASCTTGLNSIFSLCHRPAETFWFHEFKQNGGFPSHYKCTSLLSAWALCTEMKREIKQQTCQEKYNCIFVPSVFICLCLWRLSLLRRNMYSLSLYLNEDLAINSSHPRWNLQKSVNVIIWKDTFHSMLSVTSLHQDSRISILFLNNTSIYFKTTNGFISNRIS